MNIFSFVGSSLTSDLLVVIGILGVAIVVLVAVVFFSTVLLKRVLVLWQKALGDTRDVYKNAETVLNHARDEAIQITRQAETKVKEFEEALAHIGAAVGQQVKSVLEQAAQNEARRLSGDTEEFRGVYRQMIEENKKEYTRGIQAVMRDIAKTAESGGIEFLSSLQQQMLIHQSKMDHELQELRKQENEAVEAHKKEMLKKVEDSLYSLLAVISARILGNAFNLEAHQALVMRVLEDAKREGFFDL